MAAPGAGMRRVVTVEASEEVIQLRHELSNLVSYYETSEQEPHHHRGFWLIAFLMLEEPLTAVRQYTSTRSLELSELVERVTRIRFYRQELVTNLFSAGYQTRGIPREPWAEVLHAYDLPIVTKHQSKTAGAQGYRHSVAVPVYSVPVASAMAYLRIYMPSAASPTTFDILRLPAELRIEIYRRVLVFPSSGVYFDARRDTGEVRSGRKGFVIDNHVHPSRKLPRSTSVFDVCPSSRHRWTSDSPTVSIGWHEHITALLRVSKTIYTEAMPVFCENHFVFSRMSELNRFLPRAARCIAARPMLSEHTLETGGFEYRAIPWTPPLHFLTTLSVSYEPADRERSDNLSLLSAARQLRTLRIRLWETEWMSYVRKGKQRYRLPARYEGMTALCTALQRLHHLKEVRFEGDCNLLANYVADKILKTRTIASARIIADALAKDSGSKENGLAPVKVYDKGYLCPITKEDVAKNIKEAEEAATKAQEERKKLAAEKKAKVMAERTRIEAEKAVRNAEKKARDEAAESERIATEEKEMRESWALSGFGEYPNFEWH